MKAGVHRLYRQSRGQCLQVGPEFFPVQRDAQPIPLGSDDHHPGQFVGGEEPGAGIAFMRVREKDGERLGEEGLRVGPGRFGIGHLGEDVPHDQGHSTTGWGLDGLPEGQERALYIQRPARPGGCGPDPGSLQGQGGFHRGDVGEFCEGLEVEASGPLVVGEDGG